MVKEDTPSWISARISITNKFIMFGFDIVSVLCCIAIVLWSIVLVLRIAMFIFEIIKHIKNRKAYEDE